MHQHNAIVCMLVRKQRGRNNPTPHLPINRTLTRSSKPLQCEAS